MIKRVYKKLVPFRYRITILGVLKKLYGYLLYGQKVHCVCCGRSFRKFLPKSNGILVRPNAECPNCGSLERGRLLYTYLKNETSVFAGTPSVLHVSPESFLRKKFMKNPQYIDVDINPDLARYVADITSIPYSDQTYDYIICSHVLGHVKDEEKAIDELFRVLRVNGTAFILTLLNTQADKTLEDDSVLTPRQRLETYGEADLERLHAPDFIDRLKRQNVVVEVIDYREKFSSSDRQRFSLGDGQRELIFKCTRLS